VSLEKRKFGSSSKLSSSSDLTKSASPTFSSHLARFSSFFSAFPADNCRKVFVVAFKESHFDLLQRISADGGAAAIHLSGSGGKNCIMA